MLKRILSSVFGTTADERKIGATIAFLLVVVALVSSIAVSMIFQAQINAELEGALARGLNDHSGTIRWELEDAARRASDEMNKRPHFRFLMRRAADGSASPDLLRQIEAVAENIVATGRISAIALYGSGGQVIAAGGELAEKPRLALNVRVPEHARLLWQDGYLLNIAVPVMDAGRRLGTALMDIPLPRLGALFKNHSMLGKGNNMFVCGLDAGGALKCFPSRHGHNGSGMAGGVDGKPAAMADALAGRSGRRATTDAQGRQIVEAYGPIGETGLGMVMTIDAGEWSRPVRADLLRVAPLFALLILVALVLLRWRVGPLVRSVVASRARVRAVVDNAAEAIITIDARGTVQSFNPAACTIFGYSTDEVIGRNVKMLMPEPYRSGHDGYIARFLETGRGAIIGRGTREVQGQYKGGRVFPLELAVSETVLNGERVFIGMARDVSERKLAEENTARLTAILEATTDLVCIWDTRGEAIYLNAAARSLRGAERETDLGGNSIGECYPPWASRIMLGQALSTAASGEVWRGETEFLGHCGKAVPVSQVVMAHKSGGEVRMYSSVMRDISDRKRTEEELRQHNAELNQANQKLQETQSQLLQSEKMASIGQLAAGVAHEINNPIGYVHSNLGTLEKYLQDMLEVLDGYEAAEEAIVDNEILSRVRATKEKADLSYLREDLAALMKESKEGITRVKKIVQDLKDFSHVDAGEEWLTADLHQGLDSTLNIVWNEVKYKAEVRKEYGEIPGVECLPSQINQVFMNLLVNAAHAIEERGVITIRTGQEGDMVWVEIADTGKGIGIDNLKRIFDPFFTTKPVGKGTGLGLSLSYSIVQKHHGQIEVKSEEGLGTTFTVWLPVIQPVPQQANG